MKFRLLGLALLFVVTVTAIAQDNPVAVPQPPEPTQEKLFSIHGQCEMARGIQVEYAATLQRRIVELSLELDKVKAELKKATSSPSPATNP